MPRLIIGLGIALLLILAMVAISLDTRVAEDSTPLAGTETIHATAGAIYSARFADTDGKFQELGQWQHRLLVINFWATWCNPCIDEMPMLSKIHETYRVNGLQIVGIAVDSRENIANFGKKLRIGYPLLAGEMGAIELSKRLGNRLGLLPYTVVVRPGGEVIFSRMGVVTEQQMVDLALKYLVK